ncbi:MAG TPA: hypothetical protein VFP84_22405, partial [Kofleriaceae bacterium]|nr:hypothetical protein [Kofleriaceae bacterium]
PPPPPPARAAPSAAMTLGGGAPPPAPAADDTTAVRDYFTRILAIQATAPSTDTNEFANKLLASSLGGDTSGLDELARVAEEGANRARAVTPPPACAACADYHQRLIGMLGESASMVKQLKSALTSKDPAALNALSATGSSLQARANALDDQARQIKAEYGLR